MYDTKKDELIDLVEEKRIGQETDAQDLSNTENWRLWEINRFGPCQRLGILSTRAPTRQFALECAPVHLQSARRFRHIALTDRKSVV